MSEELEYCVECGKRIRNQQTHIRYFYMKHDIDNIDEVSTLHFHAKCAALFISKLTKNIHEFLENK